MQVSCCQNCIIYLCQSLITECLWAFGITTSVNFPKKKNCVKASPHKIFFITGRLKESTEKLHVTRDALHPSKRQQMYVDISDLS